ncbi:uncharacterized protein SAPINGB_P004063 [Magnusiomyces paraingens]|uniref:Major facilitator superfamily (MFS) profile domain-containing protein n=1 Tax=Magnusiomyces paraingens TaxID=2606893 RepID=A0A5E8BSK4_9ASCO|nr:uncharacterized protein SAPINGB_P004063 [Saprochaete ingens]VVT54413.1 unnamed protein product [Saprochaete ingens]
MRTHITSLCRHIANELGLHSLLSSARDVRLLILIKFVRMVAFGQSSIFLVQFFNAHGYSESLSGLFMSSTLIGDVIISYFLTLNADRIGRRRVLCIGALMMLASGVVFAVSNNFYILLLAAVIGVISPSGSDIGPFQTVEESTLAHLVAPQYRNDIYAWYSLGSALALACGHISGGWLINALTAPRIGLSSLEAYKSIFFIFAIFGGLKLLLSLSLSHKVEAPLYELSSTSSSSINNKKIEHTSTPPSETTSLLSPPQTPIDQEASLTPITPRRKFSILPELSAASTNIVVKLSLLFALDSFASSLIKSTWVSYYMTKKFNINPTVLGSTFFVTGIIASLAMLVSSSLAKRLGPVLTMALTHFPSSAILIFLPMPASFSAFFILLVLRSCTCQMDVAPKQAFLSMVVLSSERTAVMAWVNVVKTCSQIFGPSIAGFLAHENKQWICFVLAGSLKVLYDILILLTFAFKPFISSEQ